ncbi:MAG TPA: hypothetical protein VJL83_04070 [Patescibacteria group bacterium]|nr:hypothetical protein [Patescibacteria group bacterium]
MRLQTPEKIPVSSTYDPVTGRTVPSVFRWNGTTYRVRQVSYYHRERRGRLIIHIFHVTDGQHDFRILCDSETLSWRLEEVVDGTAD